MKQCHTRYPGGPYRRLHSRPHRSRPVLRQLSWLLLGACTWTLWTCGDLGTTSALAAKGTLQGEIVRLHPDLDENLSAVTATRYGLFTDVQGLQQVTFLKAPWGGYLARLQIDTPEGTVWRERNIATETWREWRMRVEKVRTGQPWQDDFLIKNTELTPDRLRVWPEVPLPPINARKSSESEAIKDYQKMSGRWFVLLEAGVRHNVTDFNHFFTDMGMIAMNWGVMLGRLMPYMSMEVGFGDLRDDFEELAGDGRSNTYGFSLGMLARQPLGRHHQFYVSGGFGYFIRSLQWGGTFLNANTGNITDGLVLEQQNWGYSLRAGFMFNRKHTTKSRFWDIGVGVQSTPAEEWHYFNETNDFFATERDMWITLSIRFGDSI